MSTSFIPLKDIIARELFDGRLEQFNIREHRSKNTTEMERCLTDGDNYVWVSVDASGCVLEFTRYGYNEVRKIFDIVGDLFQTEIVSEHEPQYHGFNTKEEWLAFEKNFAGDEIEDDHLQLLKFCRGEVHNIRPGTGTMVEAKIAKILVDQDPSLLLPGNKDKFCMKVFLINAKILSEVSYNRLVFMTMNRGGESTELAGIIRGAILECAPILQAIQLGEDG
jgi:hypothetical protein